MLDEETVRLLTSMAQQKKQSVSVVTKELIMQALELQEDRFLSQLAEEREETLNGDLVHHEDAWK
jgi:predicted transcriptional regulator